jgi:glycosyltransferase involved in cell wall biosynthesis
MNPLVSVIVPTKNSAQFLERCLLSIRTQTYPNIEVIVVDNFSVDATPDIAKRHADKFFQQGPERSPQRNYGVEQATGKYVLIIDSDMELDTEVVSQCVVRMKNGVAGVVIPEESFGVGFWAKCKQLERSFYVGIQWMEAARFFPRDLYLELGGYDTTLVSGEDWDLSQRAGEKGVIVRIDAYIHHNEGELRLLSILKKKWYYAKKFSSYASKGEHSSSLAMQTSILARYALFFRKPKMLLKEPLLSLGMLFMKTSEFAVGAVGMLVSRL